MIKNVTAFRVNYADTDQMGFVHHSNYVKYYENARWDTFRKIGLPYLEIEADGILMPVIAMDFKFIKPLFYDEEFMVVTHIKEMDGVKIEFHYETYNSDNECINKATVTTGYIRKESLKPCRPPQRILNLAQSNYNIPTTV